MFLAITHFHDFIIGKRSTDVFYSNSIFKNIVLQRSNYRIITSEGFLAFYIITGFNKILGLIERLKKVHSINFLGPLVNLNSGIVNINRGRSIWSSKETESFVSQINSIILFISELEV